MSWTSAEYLDAVGKEHDWERLKSWNRAIAAEVKIVLESQQKTVSQIWEDFQPLLLGYMAQEKNTENSELKQTIMDLRMQVNQLQRETQLLKDRNHKRED
ncbi:MAG: hypothetical protein HOM71_06480 [Deltaproteobacteria bacterium]|jgi:hypothetical protein|nr:hypothetical protein [Deltaproteobacteria bacterium]